MHLILELSLIFYRVFWSDSWALAFQSRSTALMIVDVTQKICAVQKWKFFKSPEAGAVGGRRFTRKPIFSMNTISSIGFELFRKPIHRYSQLVPRHWCQQRTDGQEPYFQFVSHQHLHVPIDPRVPHCGRWQYWLLVCYQTEQKYVPSG